jgi:hypothetical protein
MVARGWGVHVHLAYRGPRSPPRRVTMKVTPTGHATSLHGLS